MTDLSVDVVLVGGGLVGGALALALARDGFSVCVVEARAPRLQWDDDGYDLRVSALSRASQHFLDNLGVWPAIVADRATPYAHMRVWDRAGFGEIHFDAADLAEPDLGHIVENRVVIRALWQALTETAAYVRAPAAVRRLQFVDGGVELQLDDHSRVRAALLVAADGARSQIRELVGIKTSGEAYDQHAVVATVRAERGNGATAWQRFLPDGPLALLPVQRDLSSIVWSTKPEHAVQLLELPQAEFDAQLTEASEGRLGDLTLFGKRASFPLQMQHAETYVLPHVALVGDAAHVIHPLAGQGVNLGFLDAGALIDALRGGRDVGRHPGSLRSLRQYERGRKGHNAATQVAMDGFKQLFSNSHPGLSLLRNVGLGAAGRVAPLRRLFERVALGHGVELPDLNRARH